jgi:two-component system CheB/CheR fusion protein
MAERSTAEPANQRLRFPVVALGGSAGALEALQEFFGALPGDTGCAFVVLTHQQPGRESLLPDILDKASSLPVSEARTGTKLEPDQVYVDSPNGQLTLRDGEFALEAEAPAPVPESGTAAVPHPVDLFFRSLAADCGEYAVGIILSGSGTDGAVGLKEIKAESGMLMVQDPETAEFDGMPGAAVSTGLVDHSLAVAQMPRTLTEYAARLNARGEEAAAPSADLSEEVRERILEALREHTGNDFSGYKRSTLYRRVQRRMDIRRITTGEDYLEYLQTHPEELDYLFRETIVSVTRFYRDIDAWQALEVPLRRYIERLPRDHEFRAWVIGCASGEEAYTLAMIASEAMEAVGRRLPVQILATDIEPMAIQAAREGRYPAGVANDIPAELLDKYFYRQDEHYIALKALREKILFAVHNATQDPPFTRIDLLTCRNLLIYMDSELQDRLRPVFHYALEPGGLLFLGSAESLDRDCDGSQFETVDRRWKIFRRGPQQSPHVELPAMPQRAPARQARAAQRAPAVGDSDRPRGFSRTVERMLVNRHVPPCAVVNDKGEAAYFHGDMGKLFTPSSGLAGNNILSMAREGLRPTLREALYAAVEQAPAGVRRRARVRTDGGFEWFRLEASRIDEPETLRGLIAVTFEAEPERGAAEAAEQESGDTEGADARVAQLEREIQALTAEKSGTVEQLETTNEDLQAANEELQSANEELQSTNEELETSREEMESLNEELSAVNSELSEKIQQLERTNNEMTHMLNSTDLAMLFLGPSLEVRRFTDRVSDLISVRESDIGRPVGDLASNLEYDHLVDDALRVLRTHEALQTELRTKSGHWYLMRMLPYHTLDQEVDGVVTTFVNVDDVHRAQSRERFFRSIVETVREPLLVLDEDLRVLQATDNFRALFGFEADEVAGQRLFDLDAGQWDQPELRRLLEELLPQQQAIVDFELDGEFGRVGRKRLRLNARRLAAEAGEPARILLAVEDLPRAG